MSAAAALWWEVVARHRWWYRVFGAYLLLACVGVWYLPRGWRVPEVGAALAAPAALLGLVALSGLGGGDLRATRSCFPARLFTLPLSSFALASTQLVVATTLAWLWLVASLGLLRPCGAAVPLAAPALGITAAVGWLLALMWSPFPLPWLRLISTAAVLCGMSALLVAISEAWLSLNQLTAILALALSGAYLVAWNGVRLGRHGVGTVTASRINRVETPSAAADLTPFASPFRAQLSLELRSVGRIALWMTLVQLLVVLPMVLVCEYNLRARGYSIYYSRHTVTFLLVYLFLVLPALSAVIGATRSPHLVSPGGGMPGFFAARPVSATIIVLAKAMAKAVLVSVLWGGVLLLMGVCLAVSGHVGKMAVEHTPRAFIAPLVAVLTQLVLAGALLNWLVLIGTFWVGLCGRPWVLLAATVSGCALCAAVVGAWSGLGEYWHGWFVRLLWLGLAMKVAATLGVCWLLVARGHATAWAVALALQTWVLFVVPIASLVAWLLPSVNPLWSDWLTGLVVVQLIPLAQTLVAPLALDWNRHR